jgi:hypothetical protein
MRTNVISQTTVEAVRILVTVVGVAAVLFSSTVRSCFADSPSVQVAKRSPSDSNITLQGGQEGTIFKDLVVEGEDRIKIEFERPDLYIDVDPQSAPGLEWGSFQDVLDRSTPDYVSSYLKTSSLERSPYLSRPWLDLFASGDIARFQPQVEGVDRWELLIANSGGETVARFEGKGKPPKEIGWDGRSLEGKAVPPGLTYSYVLEAYDRAGNKRSFVGTGFELPSYRLITSEELVMLFSGSELSRSKGSDPRNSAIPPAILLEVVDRINAYRMVDQPVLLEVSARTYDQAKTLSMDMVKNIEPLVLGGSTRLHPVTLVNPNSPSDGTVRVVVSR